MNEMDIDNIGLDFLYTDHVIRDHIMREVAWEQSYNPLANICVNPTTTNPTITYDGYEDILTEVFNYNTQYFDWLETNKKITELEDVDPEEFEKIINGG